MTYNEVLTKVITDGIAAAERDYVRSAPKKEGAVAGFDACREQTPMKLLELLARVDVAVKRARRSNKDRYWRLRCFQAEVEWVCNVMSAASPIPFYPCTARGVMKAEEILGRVSE